MPEIDPPDPMQAAPVAPPGSRPTLPVPGARRRGGATHGRPHPPVEATAPAEPAQSPSREREAAWRRGEMLAARMSGTAAHAHPHATRARVEDRALLGHAFAALAENVRDYAIFLVDPEGIITFWGEGARLIKWWTPEEAEGGHLRLLYPEGGAEDGTAEAHLALASGTGEYTGEGERVRSDGSTFRAGVTLTALRDADGTLLGFAKVTTDLTARRAADEARASASAALAAQREAVAANQAKSGFLAEMGHEIRTPLNALLGYHDLLAMEMEGPLAAEQREYLRRASGAGRHLLQLVEEILEHSRLEAQRTTVDRRLFRIADPVALALDLMAPQTTTKGIELVDAVSGSAAEVRCVGDEYRVRQILLNLLANAVRFTPAGGRITVSAGTAQRPSPGTSLGAHGPWGWVRIEDTGAGIPADRLAAIFEPYVQAEETSAAQRGGTGLGLAISRRLARLMGGDLAVQSQVGDGSTFVLWLPTEHADGAPRPGGT